MINNENKALLIPFFRILVKVIPPYNSGIHLINIEIEKMKKVTLTAEQADIIKTATPVIVKAGKALQAKIVKAGKILNNVLVREAKKLVEAGLTAKQARDEVKAIAKPFMTQQNFSKLMVKAGLRTGATRSDKGEKIVTKEQILILWGDATPEVQAETFKALQVRMA